MRKFEFLNTIRPFLPFGQPPLSSSSSPQSRLPASTFVSLSMRCGSSGWAASTLAKKPTHTAGEFMPILLGKLDGAFKLDERLAGPIDVMQQPVGAARCTADLHGRQRWRQPSPGWWSSPALRCIGLPEGFEGCKSPVRRRILVKSHLPHPPGQLGESTQHPLRIAMQSAGGGQEARRRPFWGFWAPRLDGTARPRLDAKKSLPNGTPGEVVEFCGRSADDRSKGHSALASMSLSDLYRAYVDS